MALQKELGPLAAWRVEQGTPAKKPTVDIRSYCSPDTDDASLKLPDDSNVTVLEQGFDEPDDLDDSGDYEYRCRLQIGHLKDRELLTTPSGVLQRANRFGLYFILDEVRRFISYN